MTNNVLIESREQNLVQPVQINSPPVIEQAEEIKDTVSETNSEANLTEKMSDLRVMLDNLSEEVGSWREWHRIDYLEVIETLKSQVEEMQNEWNNMAKLPFMVAWLFLFGERLEYQLNIAAQTISSTCSAV